MAKGNIGNLLQHYIALNCANRLLNHWQHPNEPVVYADCFSMAPWEPVPRDDRERFMTMLNRFEGKARANDLVARTFITAWNAHYHPDPTPAEPQDREYPNTAVLLRTAFPNQAWEMRLHEIEDKRTDLEEWASQQSPGMYSVESCWKTSPLLVKNPIPPERAAFLMLDPYQIVHENRGDQYRDGYIDGEQISNLTGGGRLDLYNRPADQNAAPAVMTLFSFTDPDADAKDELVKARFKQWGWSIESVRCAPKTVHGRKCQHLGWILSCGLPTPVLGKPLQDAWDNWLT